MKKFAAAGRAVEEDGREVDLAHDDACAGRRAAAKSRSADEVKYNGVARDEGGGRGGGLICNALCSAAVGEDPVEKERHFHADGYGELADRFAASRSALASRQVSAAYSRKRVLRDLA